MAYSQANRLLTALVLAIWPALALGEPLTMRPLSDPLGPLPGTLDHASMANRLAARPLPPLTAFQASIQPAQSLAILRRSYLNALATLPAYGGRRGHIRSVVVEQGTTSLDALAARLDSPDVLACDPAACLLRAALYVAPGAALVIENRTLLLETETGAFIAVSGELVTYGAAIEGVRAGSPALFDDSGSAKAPRPFIVTYDDSRVHLVQSRFAHLGFDAPSAYGLTMTTGNPDRTEGTPPTGAIVECEFEDLYYGFYSHRASDVQIIGSEFSGSIVYGIDPHDYSSRIVIAGNRVFGTRQHHGIILSRGVTDSLISGNILSLNEGSGIVLDRHSDNNSIANNAIMTNKRDAIAIYESDNAIVFNNTAVAYTVGIRARNARGLILADNHLEQGRNGILLRSARAGGRARRAEDIYQEGIEATLAGNLVGSHRIGDLELECVQQLRLFADGPYWPGVAKKNGARASVTGDHIWQEVLATLKPGQSVSIENTSSCKNQPH